jgi:hypothetical protein
MVFPSHETAVSVLRPLRRACLSSAVGLQLGAGVLVALFVFIGSSCVVGAGRAEAAPSASGVWFSGSSGSRPSVLVPGQVGEVVAWAQNLGDVATDEELEVKDVLPAGVKAIGISAHAGGGASDNQGPVRCSLGKVSCSFGVFEEPTPGSIVENPGKEVVEFLPPYELIEVRIRVQVEASAKPGANEVEVSGGGASGVAAHSDPLRVGTTPAGFGFEKYGLIAESFGGGVDTQAGSHPFQLTTTVAFNNKGVNAEKNPLAVRLPKTVVDRLPAGLLGNPTPFAQCTDSQFATSPHVASEVIVNECPAASAIGVATVQFTDPEGEYLTVTAPVFSVTPLPGEPARFGFKAAGIESAFLDVSVRTGNDYGVTITSENITELVSLLSVRLTIWGVPGDKRHDISRGWECMYGFGSCPVTQTSTPPPFLVLPSSCENHLSSTISAVSWSAEGKPAEESGLVPFDPGSGIDGCNRLPFAPEVRVTPDGQAGSSPTGLNVDVHVPQTAILNGASLAESSVRGISVTLPEGVAVNPAGGDGLQACEEGQVGYLPGESTPPGTLRFTPTLGVPFCPDASKVGTVRLKVPILPNALEGAVYLGAQNANPFGSLLALYIVASDPVSGVVVKLAGQTTLSPTGQLTGTFENSPQAPFEDAELHFFGGERAPLATPARCGAYTTAATFKPWSGTEPVNASSTFQIISGPNGGPCPGATLPFSPSLTGGTINIQAGSFSPLTTTIGRGDGQQNIQSVTLHTPPGLSGLLASVKLCPEAQANEGTCPADSLIGETTVAAGVGSDPVTVTGGKVYITETYRGAPFGLSIVNPVKAGPFDLEHDTSNPAQQPACDCLVVRATIQVDPHTAALTATTDPDGEHAIPKIIDGVPVEIQKVNVNINRPGFTFNPTNCKAMAITGTILGSEGQASPVNVPFQAANCATLAFAPKFKAETKSKTSRVNGAGLTVHLTYPKAPFGSQANIAYTKVALPKQLPSRLTTLQKACLAAQFEKNPAGCPPASVVGHAKAITPLLPVPLEGPAYFVSNGSAKFPSLIVVLQGYGITVDLIGETLIKNGVTTSTFATIPDAPVSTFELTLPQGPFSALGALTNLCKQDLKMPTIFKAQNGIELKQDNQIVVTGCRSLTVTKHTKTKNKLHLTIKTTQSGTVTITSSNTRPLKQVLASGVHALTLTLAHPKKRATFHITLHAKSSSTHATLST